MGPSDPAPTALDFTGIGGTSFSSLSPLVDQVSFIGDGLTGDGTGSVQKFFVPTGAGELYLGISNAGFYNGAPGAYGDNAGFYTATYNVAGVSATPEPSSLLLFGTSLLGLAPFRRKLFGR
jgi:PEP-CTERM motif